LVEGSSPSTPTISKIKGLTANRKFEVNPFIFGIYTRIDDFEGIDFSF
jgi:hypothetical protein